MRTLSVFKLLRVSLAALLLISSTASADQKSAEAALKEKGLKRSGAHFCLPGEQELAAILKNARAAQKTLVQSARALAQLEEEAGNKQEYINQCFQQRAVLRQQLAQARNVQQHNRIALAINQLGDEIVRLQTDETMAAAVKEARSNAAAEREKYVEMLFDGRALVQHTSGQYAALAADTEVGQLVDEFNAGQSRKLTLGPSRVFGTNEKALKKLEDQVLSETIPLRRDGGLFFVDVVFNGDGAQTHEMAIDTGASIVSLPYALASAVGLEPDANSEVLQMSMADGSIVPGRKVVAKELRIGKFTVENVECVVMPSDFPDAAPLLGQTFLDKFGYKIDSAQAKLTISQVQLEQAPKARRRNGEQSR